MEPLSLFLIIVAIVAGALGWASGFFKQAAQVAGLILGIIACRMFGPQVVDMLCSGKSGGADTVIYTVLGYVGLFLVVYIGVWLVGRLLKGVLETLHIGILNRVAGAVFSICKWMFLISLILNLWAAIVPDSSLKESPAYDKILAFAPTLLGTDTAIQLSQTISAAVHG